MSALAIQVKDLHQALRVEKEMSAEKILGLETQVKDLTEAKAAFEAQAGALSAEVETAKTAQAEAEAKATEAEAARVALEAEKAEAVTELEKAKAALADPAFAAAAQSDATGTPASNDEPTNPTMTPEDFKALDPAAMNAFFRAGGKVLNG